MQQQSRVSLLSRGKQLFICFIYVLYLHHAHLVKNGWPRNFPHCSVTLMLVAAEDQGTQSFPPLFQKVDHDVFGSKLQYGSFPLRTACLTHLVSAHSLHRLPDENSFTHLSLIKCCLCIIFRLCKVP